MTEAAFAIAWTAASRSALTRLPEKVASAIKRGASAVGEGARTVASVHRHLVIATWRMADRTIRSEGEAKNGIRALP